MVMVPPPACDSAVLPCFHGCLAFFHRHFPPQSPPSPSLREGRGVSPQSAAVLPYIELQQGLSFSHSATDQLFHSQPGPTGPHPCHQVRLSPVRPGLPRLAPRPPWVTRAEASCSLPRLPLRFPHSLGLRPGTGGRLRTKVTGRGSRGVEGGVGSGLVPAFSQPRSRWG